MRKSLHVICCVVLMGCASESPKSPKWVDPRTLTPGPTRYEQLSDEQLRRLRAVQAILSEVDTSPFEKWVDDFKRDKNPDSEIRIYEAIAAAYESFSKKHVLTNQQRQEAYGLLLMRSTADLEEALSHAKFKFLTREQGGELMSGYALPAQPITGEKK